MSPDCSSNNVNIYNANNYPEAKVSRRYMIPFDKADNDENINNLTSIEDNQDSQN